MDITIFNLSRTMSSDGSRLISALLKRAGHRVTTIYLSRSASSIFKKEELQLLNHILKETDVIMVAVYSSYVTRAIMLTEFIHTTYPGLKVFWGGPHCISAPELSLRHADGICFSEGDQAVIELINKMEANEDFTDTPNMAFNVNGSYKINRALEPFTDLDSLPYYDFTLENQWLLDHDLFPMTKGIIRRRHAYYPYNKPTFFYLTSRGCPNRCTYCNNCRYISLFGRNSLRFLSVNRIIEELEFTLNQLDFFEIIFFGDDDFFTRPTKQIEDLARKYRKKIDLPFIITSSANSYRKEKMEILLDAGLKCIQMGVQSGSQRITDEVYKRNVKVSRTWEAVRQITPYNLTHNLDLLLDFIVDNPYETKNDIIQTYDYLVDLPLHTMVNIFFLAFFPGTPIYDQALKDGFIDPYQEQSSTFKFSTRAGIRVRYQLNYEMFLILLLRKLRLNCLDHQFRWREYIPQSFFRLLGSRALRAVGSLIPESFYDSLCKRIG